MPELRHGQWLLLIFGLALLLRVPTIGEKSLWLDEAYSVFQAEREELAAPVFVEDPHPPLYYVLLHYWVRVAGNGEAAVRLPSVAASVAGTGLLYLLARLLAGRHVALLAAALLAFSPLDVWYAQEARMHIFVTAFALLYAVALVWEQPLSIAVAAGALGVGLYFDYAMLPLWIALSALWFVAWWRQERRVWPVVFWIAGSVGGWLLYRDWWPYLIQSLDGSIGNVFIFARLRSFLGLSHLGADHFAAGLLAAAVVIALGGVIGGGLLENQRWQRAATVALLVGFLLVAVLMVVPRLFTVKRVLVTGWPYVLLLLAWLIMRAEAWRRWLLTLVLGVSLLASLLTLAQPKDDWRSATAYVERESAPEAAVWLDPRWNEFPYGYYAERTVPVTGDVEALAEMAVRRDEIWIVAERYHGANVPSSPAEAWLDEHWNLVLQQPFYRLEVRSYRPR